MSNFSKLEFTALDISGRNYLSWILDVEIHLDAQNLGQTIKNGNQASSQDRAKAMIFICHNLQEELKSEYLTERDPLKLWNNLKERYEHQKTVILPKARYNWMHLRLQDYKSVSEYNSALFKIVSQMKLCREKITEQDMLKRIYSTFHASNFLLQQQYREYGFTKYSQLISCLLVAEQNNKLLMKNHQSRPIGCTPFAEVNRVLFQRHKRGRGRGRGRGRNNYQTRGGHIQKNNTTSFYHKWNQPFHQKWNQTFHQKGNDLEASKRKGKSLQNNPPKDYVDMCHRYGMKGHWSRTCRTARHLVDLYLASKNDKGKDIEMHFTNHYDPFGNTQEIQFKDQYDPFGSTHLDVFDFFEDPDGNIDHLIDDGNVQIM